MSVVWGWAMPAAEKLVALKLADCADDHGRNAFPAVATIAAECGLSRRGAQLVLRRLQERGYIAVQTAATNRCSTRYQVLLGASVPLVQVEVGGEPDSPPEANGIHLQRRTTCAPGANDVRPGGEAGSPLGAHDVRPIRQGSVSKPSRAVRARDGRRSHPLDEPTVLSPRLLELFDELFAIYPQDANPFGAKLAWVALNLSEEQARLVVEHVRVRVKTGWVDRVGGVKYVPHLKTFLEERRWEERAAAGTASGAAGEWGPDGTRTMATCRECGEPVEGRVRSGRPVYPPCPRCTSDGAGDAQREERVV